MKRNLLLIAILLMVGKLPAQTLHTLIHPNDNYIELRSMMEARDGSLIISCPIFDKNEFFDIGFYMYKVSPQAKMIDSIFVENNDMNRFFMTRNPLDNNNIHVTSISNFVDSTTAVRIMFFGDNLEIEDVIDVPLEDSLINVDSYYLDEYNDIIMVYSLNSRFRTARIGLDGTLKDYVMYPELPIGWLVHRYIGLYNRNPLQYCFWGTTDSPHRINCVIIDSMFNVVEQHKYTGDLYGEYEYEGGANEQILYYDEDTYILSSFKHKKTPNFNEYMHVSKFNKNHECLLTKRFDGPDSFYRPFPIRVDKSKKEGIYYSYVTTAIGDQVAVVKMDDDFNIEWERYCLDDNGVFHWGFDMIPLDNGGVAVGGYDSAGGVFQIFLLILTDDGVTVPEMEDFVRPFCIYPNPSKDYVNIKISPDVRCEKVELYDIAGRLLKTYGSTSETSIQFDVQDLPAGNYILNITLDNGKSYSEKVVITE